MCLCLWELQSSALSQQLVEASWPKKMKSCRDYPVFESLRAFHKQTCLLIDRSAQSLSLSQQTIS